MVRAYRPYGLFSSSKVMVNYQSPEAPLPVMISRHPGPNFMANGLSNGESADKLPHAFLHTLYLSHKVKGKRN